MKKENSVSLIYFISMVALLGLRILFSTSVLDGLSSNMANYLFTILAQVVCMGIVPISLYYVLVGRKDKQKVGVMLADFGCKKKPTKKVIGQSLVVAMFLTFLTTFASMFWQIIIKLFGYTGGTNVSTNYYNVWILLLNIVMVGLLPAIFEEVTNRGLLLSSYRKSYGVKYIWLSALLFALMHQNITQVFYAFVGGLIMGHMVYYTKSLYPAMIIHFFNNASSVLRDYGSQHGGFLQIYDNILNLLLSNLLTMIILGVGVYFAIKYLIKYLKKIKVESITEEFGCSEVLVQSQSSSVEQSKAHEDPFNINGNEQKQAIYGLEQISTDKDPFNISGNERKQVYTEAISMLDKPKGKIYLNAYIIGSIVIGVLATVSTLIWGIVR